jgi:hypothetical protein
MPAQMKLEDLELRVIDRALFERLDVFVDLTRNGLAFSFLNAEGARVYQDIADPVGVDFSGCGFRVYSPPLGENAPGVSLVMIGRAFTLASFNYRVQTMKARPPKPQSIRRRFNHPYRYAGGKLGDGIKLVTRSTRWGNPYRVEDYGRSSAVARFRRDLEQMPEDELRAWLQPLADARGLYCPCPTGEKCHADVILRYLDDLFPLPADGGACE